MYDAIDPTEDQILGWAEHNDHADGALATLAEEREDAEREADAQRVIDTIDCPTCGSVAGLACAAMPHRDGPTIPMATTWPHPARMHAAGLICHRTGCDGCPKVITLVPSRTMRDWIGQWQGAAALKVGNVRFGINYVDQFGTARREPYGAELPGPYASVFTLPVAIAAVPIPDEVPDLICAIGDLLLIDGQAFQIARAGIGRIRLDLAPTQLDRPAAIGASNVAKIIDPLFDQLDSADRTLDALTEHPRPGTPLATLTTMRQRIDHAATALRQISDQAEAMAHAEAELPQPPTD